MSTPVTVTVVIPALDAEETIADQLRALSLQVDPPRFEVIVADNGSTDRTSEVVGAWMEQVPGLRVVDASRRRGVSVARNEGWRAAGGGVVLFCDADDVVGVGWVAAMAERLQVAPIVGGRFELRRFNSQFRRPAEESGVYTICGVPYAVGASAGFRREVLESLDGFDEDWDRGGGDDVEICLRAAQLGWLVAEAPGAVVSRRLRCGRRELLRQYFRYGQEQARTRKAFPDLVQPPGIFELVNRWLSTVAKLPGACLRSSDLRGIEYLGLQVGRLVGSFRYRIWFP